MNTALLRAACTSGLLLVAFSANSPAAGAAMGYGPGGSLAIPPRASGTAIASVSAVQHAVTNKWSSPCPCNAGLPDGPSGALAAPARRATPASSIQPHETSIPSQGAFDWADASMGAGFTVVLGLLVAGGTLMFSRRRVREQLRAS